MASAKSWETLAEACVDPRHGFFRFLITHTNTERRGREGSRKGASETETETKRDGDPQHSCSCPTLSQDHFAIGRLCIFPSMRFQSACSFNTQKFAHLLDSLVRVSRRIQISKNQNDRNREKRGQRTGRGQNGEEGGQKARKKRRDQRREK